MSGNKIGGLKARDANYERHGADFYAKIGHLGGKAGHTGGFYNNPEKAAEAGRKGGKISRRTGIKNGQAKRVREVMGDETV